MRGAPGARRPRHRSRCASSEPSSSAARNVGGSPQLSSTVPPWPSRLPSPSAGPPLPDHRPRAAGRRRYRHQRTSSHRRQRRPAPRHGPPDQPVQPPYLSSVLDGSRRGTVGPVTSRSVEEVARWVDAARAVAVLTGAGIRPTAASRTSAGRKGVWTKNPAAEKAAHISHYLADPAVRQRAWRSRSNPGLLGPAERRSPGARRPRAAGHAPHADHPEHRRPAPGGRVGSGAGGRGARHDPRGGVPRVRGSGADAGRPRPGAGRRGRPAVSSCGGILKSATICFGQNLVAEDLERADRGGGRRATCCWPSAPPSRCTRRPTSSHSRGAPGPAS